MGMKIVSNTKNLLFGEFIIFVVLVVMCFTSFPETILLIPFVMLVAAIVNLFTVVSLIADRPRLYLLYIAMLILIPAFPLILAYFLYDGLW